MAFIMLTSHTDNFIPHCLTKQQNKQIQVKTRPVVGMGSHNKINLRVLNSSQVLHGQHMLIFRLEYYWYLHVGRTNRVFKICICPLEIQFPHRDIGQGDLLLMATSSSTTVQPKRNAQTKFSYNQFANLVAFSLHVNLARISSQIG